MFYDQSRSQFWLQIARRPIQYLYTVMMGKAILTGKWNFLSWDDGMYPAWCSTDIQYDVREDKYSNKEAIDV